MAGAGEKAEGPIGFSVAKQKIADGHNTDPALFFISSALCLVMCRVRLGGPNPSVPEHGQTNTVML